MTFLQGFPFTALIKGCGGARVQSNYKLDGAIYRVLLYKYLPLEYAKTFVERGEVLFRSLSYFRKVEHAERGDEAEGVHIDAPDNDVRLDNLTRGTSITGRFRFLNSLDQDKVYAYCFSTQLSRELFERFNADACVVLARTNPFFLRCSLAAPHHFPLDPPGFSHRHVEYFDPANSAILPVKEPSNLPFFKHKSFSAQQEYRAVFAKRGGFTLVERIVQPEFTFAEEVAAGKPSETMLQLGSLASIASIVLRSDLPGPIAR